MLALPSSVAAVFFLPVAVVCFFVTWTDLRFMRIKDHSVLTLIAIYVVLGFVVMPFDMWTGGLLRMAVVFALALLFWMGGAMGGGDAKFITAAAPFVMPADLPTVAMILMAGLLGGFATHRLVRASSLTALAPKWRSWRVKRFPAGLVLGSTLTAYIGLAVVYGQ